MADDRFEKYRADLRRLDDLIRRGRVGSRVYNSLIGELARRRGELPHGQRAQADAYLDQLRHAREADAEAAGPSADERVTGKGDDRHRPSRRPEPTAALPGSEERVKEFIRRRRRGLNLFDADDAPDDPRRGLAGILRRNGSHKGSRDAAGMSVAPNGRQTKIQPPVVRRGFAANLHTARRNRDLKQEALAKKAGLTQQHLSLLERGQRRPSLEVLRALAEALGVSADRLVGLKTTPAG